MFASGIAMSQIAPILPLYIRNLGVTNNSQIDILAGLAFGITYIVAAVFSPLWGSVADKFGRKKILIITSLGMGIFVTALGFVPNITWLFVLRILLGVITGFNAACTALIASQVDREHAGVALGTLATASIVGGLVGPIIGGAIDTAIGTKYVFIITGPLMFVSFFLTLFFVKENFIPHEHKKAKKSFKEIWKEIPHKQLTATLCVTYFVITLGLYSIEPIITQYVEQLHVSMSLVAFLGGVAFSVAGLSNMIGSPLLGRVSDKKGAHKVLFFTLIAAACIYLPQAFVTNVWELIALRFLLGFTLGGMGPSVNVLVRNITPDEHTGRIFGIVTAAMFLGIFVGSFMGGEVSAAAGIPTVLMITAALMLANGIWVFFTVYRGFQKRERELEAPRELGEPSESDPAIPVLH